MMILSIIYLSAIVVIGVSVLAGAVLYRVDKNADRQERNGR
jgi:hypothetical protein